MLFLAYLLRWCFPALQICTFLSAILVRPISGDSSEERATDQTTIYFWPFQAPGIYIYIDTHKYTHMCIHIYIYISISRFIRLYRDISLRGLRSPFRQTFAILAARFRGHAESGEPEAKHLNFLPRGATLDSLVASGHPPPHPPPRAPNSVITLPTCAGHG